ncbi:MAG: SpvB/TcaC N-terminal domain-containing protein, partial [Myxococcota bacterium]
MARRAFGPQVPRILGVLQPGSILVLTLELLVPGGARSAAVDGSTLLAERGSVGVVSPASGVARAASDPFTGAAMLPVPIALPPGTGGLTPAVSLRYSSEARQDSWVGTGWSLGFGGIRRSLQHGVPSYVDATDVFELDGEELVPDPSDPTRYHTLRESFLRIRRVSFDAQTNTWVPDAQGDVWEVRSRDGTASRFGADPAAHASTIPGPAPGSAPFAWLLDEREDVHGNAFTVSYSQGDPNSPDPGARYPSEVRYTLRRNGALLESLNPADPSSVDRVVRFTLEPRPDVSLRYSAGIEQRLSQRLKQIDVTVGGALFRRYELGYTPSPDSQRSLLTQVSELGSDADSAQPTPPRTMSFSYRSNVAAGTLGWALAPSWQLPADIAFIDPNGQTPGQDGGARIADVNGDGLPDLVRHVIQADASCQNPGTMLSDAVYLNTGSGFALAPAGQFALPPSAFFTFDCAGTHVTSNGLLLADLTADGRADLRVGNGLWDFGSFGPVGFMGFIASVAWHEESHVNTGSGWSTASQSTEFSRDPNGVAFTRMSLAESTVDQNLSVGGNYALAELNGDGCPDWIQRQVRSSAFVDDGTVSYQPFIGQDTVLNRYALGRCDGTFDPPQTDRFQICALSATATSCLYDAALSRQKLTMTVGNFGGPVQALTFSEAARLGKRYLDVNGDGLDDHVTSLFTAARVGAGADPNDLRNVYLNHGSDLVRDDRWILPTFVDREAPVGTTTDQGVRIADLNGDGHVDLIHSLFPPSGNPKRLWLGTGIPSSPWIEQTLGAGPTEWR